MADKTAIEWTDATWNPIVGCSVVSPGCANCYAMRLAGTRLKHHPSRAGLTRESKAGPVWTGETRFDERALLQPLRWRRPRKIFVCAHSDLFYEATPDEWIDRVFAVMALCPQHTFQVLTKRPRQMRAYLHELRGQAGGSLDTLAYLRLRRAAEFVVRNEPPGAYDWATGWPLPNVWLGVTAEDQTRADERVPVLLATPAAKRFVSVEPMLGEIDLTRLDMRTALGLEHDPLTPVHHYDALRGHSDIHPIHGAEPNWARLDWVICGGESGPGARPMHPDWARSLRDQCTSAGVPFFFKQWGEYSDQGPAWGTAAGSARDLAGCVFVRPDGSVTRCHEESGRGAHAMYREGKRAAGRLLDAREWSQLPAVGGGTDG